MTEPVESYELEMGGPDRSDPDRSRQHPSWARIIAVVLTFAVGVTIGVAATMRQRDSAAARDAASALSLTVVSNGWPSPASGSDRLDVDLRVLNGGPRPVQIQSVGVEFPGFAVGEVADRNATVEPDRWVSASAQTGEVDCAREVGEEEAAVAVVTVRLESGDVREVQEPINTVGNYRPVDFWTQACLPVESAGIWADIGPPVSMVEDASGPAVVAQLSGYWGPATAVELVAVSGNTTYNLEAETLGPVSAQETITVRFTVRECPGDLIASQEFLLQGFLAEFLIRDVPTHLPVDAYRSEIVVMLVDLVYRSCADV